MSRARFARWEFGRRTYSAQIVAGVLLLLICTGLMAIALNRWQDARQDFQVQSQRYETALQRTQSESVPQDPESEKRLSEKNALRLEFVKDFQRRRAFDWAAWLSCASHLANEHSIVQQLSVDVSKAHANLATQVSGTQQAMSANATLGCFADSRIPLYFKRCQRPDDATKGLICEFESGKP